ncbi:MAG: DUF4396 domain-containing protein [Pseudohongiellaceae bacterium]
MQSALSFWRDGSVWRQSAHNTKWCLLGCALGDYGTILFFQFTAIPWPALAIFALAMTNGLLTSIALETIILRRGGMQWQNALRTALGMSLISMLAMETAMNLTDYLIVGEARLTWSVIPFSLTAGFLTPLPYNYWRLKAHGKACH